MNNRYRVVIGLVIVVLVVLVGLTFTLETGAETPEPVEFDDTVSVGLTLEAERGLEDDVRLPQVQTFYSQYEYVVGYWGVERFVEDRNQPGHQQRFGYPLTVYVSDYVGTEVDLNDDGYPTTEFEPAWVEAEDAWYVVGSDARTPTGETVVSFADQEAADAFADDHGGEVVTWEAALGIPFESDGAEVARDSVADRHAHADALVDTAQPLHDREVSTVVGEDVETIQQGIDDAPEDTTVFVPEGTYNETVEINRSITLTGESGTTISGDGNGSVITITAPDVGVDGLSITGVGTTYRNASSVPGEPVDDWDDTFQTFYGGTDAGISAHHATGLAVQDVSIDTPANGLILRSSPDAVVDTVTIRGNDDWTETFANVIVIQSPGVIQNSTVLDGRDSVYLYRSEGMVVRDNELQGGILGVHLMHTDRTLIADNVIQEYANTGIYVMTGPEGNAIVGNDVRDADVGIWAGGTDSYVGENSVSGADVGLRMDAHASIYEHNVLAGNELGALEGAVLPTNQVTGNDFVANDVHADVGPGPLRVWTVGADGNYWQGATSIVDGDPPHRAYSPTDTVDSRLHMTDGAATLARAPALDALAGLESSVSGMQSASIVDLAPTCEPNNPSILDRTEYADDAWPCTGTAPQDR